MQDHDAAESPPGDVGTEIWQPDDVVLTTVGIDIGSTTSHLQFSRLRLQRPVGFSSQFVQVERVTLHRSPIALTPYRRDGTIDAAALGAFIDEAYSAARLTPGRVDTGAVILTGAALNRPNAAEIGELFAARSGSFVRATAGHRLESILAAHGSGAVARSRCEGSVLLNIDVGGGTTKLALVDRGEVVATSAIRVGARIEAPVPAMADAIMRAARGEDTGPLALLGPLPARPTPEIVTLSGGVAEHFYRRDATDHGDRGLALAAALRDRVDLLPGTVAEPDEAIRATVIGASQFSVHLSGSTIFVSDEPVLPLENVPVVAVALGQVSEVGALEGAIRDAVERSGHASTVAVALSVRGEPAYQRVRAIAEGLSRGLGSRRPLVAAIGGDLALSVGRILAEELCVEGGIVVLDGVELADLDYIDVGKVVRPAGVVPIVVKTLVMSGP